MNLRNAISEKLPPSIKSILRGKTSKRERQKLNSLKKIECDTSNLLSLDNLDLANIFCSENIKSSWVDTKSELDKFNIPDLTGGVNPGDRRAIFYLSRYFEPELVLEIGTHIGASTVNIASALHKNQLNNTTQPILKTLDIRDVNSISEKPWLKYGTKKSPYEMIKNLNYDNFVQFITDTSFNFFESSEDKFDFIFLDGDHSSETVYKEIPLALKKLNKGGVILLHDYFPEGKPLWSNKSIIHGPYLATERHMKDGADFSITPLGDLPWPTKLNSNTTSLALLLKINV